MSVALGANTNILMSPKQNIEPTYLNSLIIIRRTHNLHSHPRREREIRRHLHLDLASVDTLKLERLLAIEGDRLADEADDGLVPVSRMEHGCV